MLFVYLSVCVLSLVHSGVTKYVEEKDPSTPVCGINEIATDCRRICPPQTCVSKYAIFLCIEKIPCEKGCDCVPNYLRNDKGICIPSEKCPPLKPKPICGYNEVSVPCRQICPPQNCEIAYTEYNCTEETKICEPGCDCLPDHLRNGSGICIPNDHCPYPSTPVCGINEIATDCRRICPPQTCLSKYVFFLCIEKIPCESGCDCVPNYLRNDKGICIPSEKCPPPKPKPICGYNEVSVPCRQICPPQNCEIAYTEYNCTEETKICEPGCDCLPDHLRNGSGICIPNDHCPYPSTPVCGINEIATDCRRICPPQTCLSKYVFFLCIEKIPCESGCDCVPNYLRNDKGICIPSEKCPPPKPKPICGYNEVSVPCRQICPPQNCEIAYTEYNCTEETKICEPGCDCLPDHLRNGSGICIPNDHCPYPSTPVCGINEIARDCRRICPPQTCLSKYALFRCIADIPCEPGCDCVPNYLRNNKGICIPSEKCPPLKPEPICGYNEVSVPCRQICPPQNCEIAYTDYACTNESKICEPGCNCLPDHLRNGSGICIPNDHCPYPSTPVCGINEIARDCKKICPPQSCQSKYIEYDCIQDIPCEPGCDCVVNYLRNDEGICIPSKKCPPLEPEPTCGYNEVSVPCRQICPPQNCDIAYTDYACTNESKICEPGCDCLPDHLRNGSGICIPNDQCPGPCQVPDECKRTCASPNPLNCVYNPPKENRKGCECKEGYILSEKGGDCIPIENCPPEIACHGDPNAVPKRCPKPCPSTCDSPNQTPCKRACYPLACECKPGHLLSNETGLCILPDKCPGGNPCGKNGRFVDCVRDCPDVYCPVDDSRALVFCDPPAGECLSGCICNLNNKKKSREHPKCITSSDCPPVNCTRPNEKWSPCPSACLAENCDDVNNQPTTCNTLVLNCQPKCVCKKSHFRNSSGICIPAKDCPKGCEGDLNAVFNECPSACELTCKTPKFDVCTDQCMPPGCVCKSGFVLNEIDGKCTELENCPAPECEDVNAEFKSCTSACEPTCASPGPYQVCTDECRPARCVCKEGFVLNEKDGKCVKPEHCPAR